MYNPKKKQEIFQLFQSVLRGKKNPTSVNAACRVISSYFDELSEDENWVLCGLMATCPSYRLVQKHKEQIFKWCKHSQEIARVNVTLILDRMIAHGDREAKAALETMREDSSSSVRKNVAICLKKHSVKKKPTRSL